MSVDLPAPFSPSSAWTSPARRSRSTRSLATRLPKRFVTPRSSRAGASTTAVGLLDFRRDVGDLARLDPVLDLLDLVLVLGPDVVDLAEADAVGLDVEDGVAGLELVVLQALDRLEHRLVDLLERRGHDVRPQVGLVGVHADALLVGVLGGVERAEAAGAGDLEHDLRPLLDLVR